MRDYRKIEAWRLADDLTVAVCRESQKFPKEEIYGLTSQLRRASCSVPSNIAEGASRSSQRDYLYFLSIARGSLAATRFFLHLAGSTQTTLDEQAGHVFGCLHGLIRAVKKESGKLLAGLGPKVLGP